MRGVGSGTRGVMDAPRRPLEGFLDPQKGSRVAPGPRWFIRQLRAIFVILLITD